MTISYEHTVTRVCDALKRIDGMPASKGRRVWTEAVIEAVSLVGKELGWRVCPDYPDGERAWLYDLVWFRNAYERSPDERLEEVGLVLESEWDKNFGQIRRDFEKLLIARCPVKVMIFDTRGDHLDRLMSGLQQYKSRDLGETYILAGFADRNGEYRFDFRIEPPIAAATS
jgi:hypothetical protein